MSGALKPSDRQIFYVHRTADGGSLAELSIVEILADVRAEAGQTVPAGSVGTVVVVAREGEGYIVEFSEPAGTLACVEAHLVRAA